MIVRKFNGNKPKVLLLQGSSRDKDTCPNMNSKSHSIVDYMLDKYSPFIEFEVIDLAINQSKKPTIQPCKGCISTSGGYHCHFPCISPTQRVHTVDGFKPIIDIKVGDILQDGNIVTKHLMTSDSELIYELKLTDGRRLELTSNHKVKVLSNTRFRDKKSNWLYYRKENWVDLKDINIGDKIPYIVTDDIYHNNSQYDDYLFEIYGLIWGDGTFSNDTPILYIDSKEKEFLNIIKDKFSKDIISIKDHKIDHTKKINDEYEIYDTKMLKVNFGVKIGREMKTMFEKSKASERRLNIDIFKTKNQIFNFLNGWISTDGSINKTGGINIYNTSYDLLRDTQLLLSRLSITSNITDMRHIKCIVRGKEHNRCSILSISDQKSLDILIKNTTLLNPKKQSKLNNKKNKRILSHKFSKVKSINEIGYSPVYDIEVSNSHEFNCEGINVHNCSCYFKGDEKKPDLMHELDIYDKLQSCDAFIIVSPIHWYSLTSQVKTFFDRLVCVNQTLAVDDAKKLMGPDNIKDSKVTGKFSKSGKYENMLRNHLEGKVAAFYVHGDDGAKDYTKNPLPESYDVMMDPFSIDPKSAVLPYIMQMKYSGVFVPDELVQAFHINKGIDYYTSNITFDKQKEFKERADELLENLLTYLEDKKL